MFKNRKSDQKNKNKKYIWLFLRIIVSIVLLGILFFIMRGKFDDLLKVVSSVDKGLFLIALSVAFSIYIMHSFRLKYLFEVQGINFSGIEALRIFFVGLFFNNFMPSTIGGDAVKLYYAKKRADNFIEPISSIVMDRLLGLLALTLIGLFGIVFKGELINDITVKYIILIFFFTIALFFLLIFFKGFFKFIISIFNFFKLKKLISLVERLADTVYKFRKSYKTINAFFLSITGQMLAIFGVYMMSRSLSLNLPVYTFYVIIPVIQIVSAFPSINGLGIREGAFVYFFRDFMATEYALALSILYIGIIIPPSIVGCIIYMFYGKINKKEVLV